MRPDAARGAGQLAMLVPSQAPDPGHAATVEDVIGVALRLAGMVHDEDPADTAGFMAGQPPEVLAALPYVLAAMVDVDRTPRELLAWLEWPQPIRYRGATAVAPPSALLAARPRPDRGRECGTEGGWKEHGRLRERRCDLCEIAHAAWRRDEKAAGRPARRPRKVTRIRPAAVQLALSFEAEGDANAA